MIALGKEHKQVAEIAAALIAQSPYVFNGSQRITTLASDAEQPLVDQTAKKRAGDFGLNNEVSLWWIE
jgi:hypothetical protein